MDQLDVSQIEITCMDLNGVSWKKIFLSINQKTDKVQIHFVSTLPEVLEIAPSMLHITETKDILTNKFVMLEIDKASIVLVNNFHMKLKDHISPCDAKYDNEKDLLIVKFSNDEKIKRQINLKYPIIYSHNKEGKIIEFQISNASKVL